MKKNIYFFQWVSDLGGADTRLKELIQLFSESDKYNLFAIPNDNFRLSEQNNVAFLKQHNVKISDFFLKNGESKKLNQWA
jgi:hypothetical protein